MARIPLIGLLGGPGSGKSSVAREFQSLGAGLVSADAINHEILRQPDVLKRIKTLWGNDILDSDGQISRKLLGEKLFGNKAEMDKLTGWLHPLIRERQAACVEALAQDPTVEMIVLDIPLLLETGQQDVCNFLVFVECDFETRALRVRQTRGWDRQMLEKVENMQYRLDYKMEIADFHIGNAGSREDTRRQVKDIFGRIIARFRS